VVNIVPIINDVDVKLAVLLTEIKLPETIAFDVVFPIVIVVFTTFTPLVVPNVPTFKLDDTLAVPVIVKLEQAVSKPLTPNVLRAFAAPAIPNVL